MRWELGEEQQAVREALRDWLGDVASSQQIRSWHASDDEAEFEALLADAGWSGVGYPEDWGGSGGALLEQALVAEALACAVAPSARWLSNAVAVQALGAAAPDVLTDDLTAALVVSADAPPDDGGRTLVLERDGIHGNVVNVLGADRAGMLVVPVRVSGRRQLLVVRADAPGVRVQGHRLLDRSRSVAEVSFDGAVGELAVPTAREALRKASAAAAVLVAADSLGALSRMLEMTVEYSKQREQFGTPIGSFQAVKHEAASMLVAVEAARSIVYFAAQSVAIESPGWAVHAAIAKAQVCPSAVAGADSALRLHGAIGYTWEYDLQLLYKRAKLNEPLFGGAGCWNERIATTLPLVVR